MTSALPRLLIAATKSGGGKTTVVCGLLQLLKNRGLSPAACKCGPDYIDPLFHREIIGAKSSNLDLYFTNEATVRRLLSESAADCDLAILEGVMGYYDGLGGVTDEASAYHLARATKTPVVLVLDAKGSSLSLCAQVKGFLEFRRDSGICAVILNRATAGQYQMLAPLLEKECGICVLGYLPHLPQCQLESRHLGLITAQEVTDLHQKLSLLAKTMEETLNIPALLALAKAAPPLSVEALSITPVTTTAPTLAVARDKAFCFYYGENLALLESYGAKIQYFSPLDDAALPPCHGLYLGGGYPELYARALGENTSMTRSIGEKIARGLPTLAECGGFLYLLENLECTALVGALPGACCNTKKLSRFGYVELTAQKDNLLCPVGASIRGHEFHYFDADDCGADFLAQKPVSGKSWRCMHATDTLVAGFPHLYFPANPAFAARLVAALTRYQEDNP